MYAVSMPNDARIADRKLTTALMVLPAVVAAALGAAVAHLFVQSGAVLVVIALLGVWIGGFGPRFAALGLMAFMAYYFALLLHPNSALLAAFAMAAAAGTIWAYLFRFAIVAERPNRVLLGGLDAFRARLVLMFDSLIDAVSAARWDPDVRKRVRADLSQLQRCAAFLQGQLRVIDPASAGLHVRPDELRLLVFDIELAATNAITAAQDVARAGAAVPVVLRGQLAGMLDHTQEQLRRQGSKDASSTSPFVPPEVWPEKARRLHEAVRELLRAASALQDVRTDDSTNPRATARETTPDAVSRASHIAASSGPEQLNAAALGHGLLAPTSRRAIQATVATGLALLAGAAVTSAHQYWAALAAFLVLGGTSTVEETMLKGIQRIVGTLMGAVIGFGVATFTGADPFVVMPLLVVCIFAMMYLGPVSQAMNVFWMTMMLSLLYEFLGTLTKETLQVRVLETIIGAGIAFGASVLLLSVRSRKKVNDDAMALLKTLDDITQICIKRLAGSSDIPSLIDQTLMLNQRFRQLYFRVEPLRRAPGAMGLDGIERRLTAIGALTYYARHLIKVTETLAPGDAPLQTDAGVQLGTIAHDNITALIQILDKELPGPVHGSEDLPLQPDTPGSRSEGSSAKCEVAVHYLVRINQTVLAIIEDLTRNTAESTHGAKTPSLAL